MTNHVHLVAIPERPDSLARALGQCRSRYAQGFNRRYGRTGDLWQNRFYSCPLGRTQLVRALLYVDLNPVRAGLVGRAEEYPWSSARAHAEGPIHWEPLIWGVGARFVPRMIGARRWSVERMRETRLGRRPEREIRLGMTGSWPNWSERQDEHCGASRPATAQIAGRDGLSGSSGAGSCEKIPRELK